MSKDPLAAYRKSPHGRGCAVCGPPTVARVELRLMEKMPKGVPLKMVASRSGSYCAEHAVAAFESAKATL
jgi:hypothetical protein